MAGSSPNDALPDRPAGRPWTERLLLASLCAGMLWLYGWYASPTEPLFATFGGKEDYYNLLIRGFAKGHLSMDVTPDPAFLASPDPYKPSRRTGTYLHDASFYHGRYYMYFGATPALVLYGPFHALTGWYLRDQQAVPILVGAGFLFGTALLVLVRRRHFPALGTIPLLMGVLAWGGTPLLFLLIRRPRCWEAPIACAFAFLALALLCLAQWYGGGRKLRWLALASAAYGLAVASRPTYLFGASCLLVPLGFLWAGRRTLAAPGRALALAFAAAAVPLGLIVAGLLVYNYERFDAFFNFGWRYQLTFNDEVDLKHFGTEWMPLNLYNNFLAPAQLGSFFPHFFPIDAAKGPPGYQGVEDPYGILVNAPFLLLSLAALLAARRSAGLRGLILSGAVAFMAIAPLLMTFFSACNRYEVDFAPALAFLAVVGFWESWEVWGRGSGWLHASFVAFSSLLLAWSLAFNLLAGIGHNELLLIKEPRTYGALADALGEPRFVLDRLVGRTYGPLELSLRFPAFAGQRLEPLVVTGVGAHSDYLYAYYPDEGHVTFGFEHTEFGGATSDPIPVDRTRVHTLRVSLGSLYPPPGDPYYEHVGSDAARQRQTMLRVSLDGREVLTQVVNFYPGMSPLPRIGRSGHAQAMETRFSGEIVSVRRLDADRLEAGQRFDNAGAFALTFSVPPAQIVGRCDPLICAGVPGRADTLSIQYVDATHVKFGMDHWGVSYMDTPVVELKPDTKQSLVASFGSFYPDAARPSDVPEETWEAAKGRLVLVYNGRVILNIAQSFHPATDAQVSLAANTVGSSTCSSDFAGKIYSYRRLTHGFPGFADPGASQ